MLKQDDAADDEKISQCGRQRPEEHVPQKLSADEVFVFLQREEKGGDADRRGADERELHRRQRIGEDRKDRNQRQNEGENVFYKEERSGTLDVVDDLPAFRNDGRHGGKVGVQQHQVRNLTGDVAAGGHGDAAIGLFERQHIVDAVAGHSDGVSGFF